MHHAFDSSSEHPTKSLVKSEVSNWTLPRATRSKSGSKGIKGERHARGLDPNPRPKDESNLCQTAPLPDCWLYRLFMACWRSVSLWTVSIVRLGRDIVTQALGQRHHKTSLNGEAYKAIRLGADNRCTSIWATSKTNRGLWPRSDKLKQNARVPLAYCICHTSCRIYETIALSTT